MHKKSDNYVDIEQHETFLEECIEFDYNYKNKNHSEYNSDLYLFDMYSGICGTSIFFPESKESPRVVIDFGYYAGPYQHQQMGFEEYMEFLIQTKGIKAARRLYFDDEENKDLLKPDLTDWPDEYFFNEG